MSCARTRANFGGSGHPRFRYSRLRSHPNPDIPGVGRISVSSCTCTCSRLSPYAPHDPPPRLTFKSTRTHSVYNMYLQLPSQSRSHPSQSVHTMKACLSPKEHFAASTQLASAYICASCLFPTNAPHTSNCPHLHSPHGTSKPARKTSSVSCNLSRTDRRLHHHHHQQLYASAAEQRVQVAHHTTHSPSTMRCSFSKLHTIRSWTSERDLGMKVLPQN